MMKEVRSSNVTNKKIEAVFVAYFNISDKVNKIDRPTKCGESLFISVQLPVRTI